MLLEPMCYTRECKHFLGIIQPDGTELTETVNCRAFPEGIPDAIAYGDDKHALPLEVQGNDIVYEKGERY